MPEFFNGGNNDHDEEKGRSSGSSIGSIILLCIIGLPALISGFLIFQLLRKAKLRPSLISFISFTIIAAIALMWRIFDYAERFSRYFSSWESAQTIVENWNELLWPVLSVYIVVGVFIGWTYTLFQARSLVRKPELLAYKGSWTYDFKYRKTPFEIWRRKKRIQGLKEGKYRGDTQAPLGIDETDKDILSQSSDEIALRHDEEAVMHTLITGASGSGKAQHKDTLIPTTEGMKTVGAVNVGDILYDEKGNETTVLAKYQPMTPDHYKLIFSDGTEIKACGDHLWTVENLCKSPYKEVVGLSLKEHDDSQSLLNSYSETLSTRDMYESGIRVEGASKALKYSIPVVSNPVPFSEKELKVSPYTLGAWLGDGCSRSGNICSIDKEVRDKIISDGYSLCTEKEYKESLKDIPDEYLYSSVQQRLDLISGLMDTEGWVDPNGIVEIGLTNENIIKKTRQIIASLGWKPDKIREEMPYTVNGKKEIAGKKVYTFSFAPDKQIFNVKQKADRLQARLDNKDSTEVIKQKRRYIVDIVPIEDNPADYYCFSVDSPSHLYLCSESFISTHNTISMLSLIKANIYAGKPVIVLDLKRSPDLASKLAKWANDNKDEHGSEFYHFVNGSPESYDIPDSKGQAHYDPLSQGNNTSKANMILGMREYDQASAVYKVTMQRLLAVMFSMLEKVKKLREETGNTDICSSIDWDNGGIYLLNSASKAANFIELLHVVMKEFEGEEIADMAKEVFNETSKRQSQLSLTLGQLQGQMQTIIASEYGPWLKTEPGSRHIDLFKLSNKRGSVVLFSLNSDDEKEFSRFFGSIVMADITRASASRRNVSVEDLVNIYIDEFQILVPDTVTDLLEKARASEMGITLAQQSLSQVMKGIVGDGEAYLQSILDTCSNFIFHAGAGEETAKKMSAIVGKKWVEVYSVNKRRDNFFFSLNWKNNRQLLVNTSKEERNKIDPQDFQSLSSPSSSNNFRSEAIIIKKAGADKLFASSGGSVAKKIWMIPDSEILDKHYKPSNAETKRIFAENHMDKDEEDLLPSSILIESQKDAAEEIQKHLKRSKIQKLKGIPSGSSDNANFEIEEEDVEPYFSGLDPESDVEDNNSYEELDDSKIFVKDTSVDTDDDWSLEDIMDDDEEEEKAVEKPVKKPVKKSASSALKAAPSKGLPKFDKSPKKLPRKSGKLPMPPK